MLDGVLKQFSKLVCSDMSLLDQLQHGSEVASLIGQLSRRQLRQIDEQRGFDARCDRPKLGTPFHQIRDGPQRRPATSSGVEDDWQDRLQPQIGERLVMFRPLPFLVVENLQLVLGQSERNEPIRFRLMLDQDVDQHVLLQGPAVFREQRSAEHDIRFDVRVVPPNEVRLHQLEAIKVDKSSQRRTRNVQQLADVAGMLQQQFDAVFFEVPHQLADASDLSGSLFH